jgi:hypothetical protein
VPDAFLAVGRRVRRNFEQGLPHRRLISGFFYLHESARCFVRCIANISLDLVPAIWLYPSLPSLFVVRTNKLTCPNLNEEAIAPLATKQST